MEKLNCAWSVKTVHLPRSLVDFFKRRIMEILLTKLKTLIPRILIDQVKKLTMRQQLDQITGQIVKDIKLIHLKCVRIFTTRNKIKTRHIARDSSRKFLQSEE